MSTPPRHGLAAALSLLLTGSAEVAAAPPPAALSLSSPNLPVHELIAAAGYWQSACGGRGGALPAITIGGPGVPVEVRRRGDSWSPNRRCGMTSVRRRDGEVVAYVVDVFLKQRNGAPCFPLVDEIAHELGHVLGLADDASAEGVGTIMGVRARNVRRRVDAGTCSRVAALAARGQALASLPKPAADEGAGASRRGGLLTPGDAAPAAAGSPLEARGSGGGGSASTARLSLDWAVPGARPPAPE